MLLHLLNEGKFVDGIIDLFETVNPFNNKYVLLTDNPRQIQSESYINTKYLNIIRPGGAEYRSLLNESKLYDAILLHYLDAPKASFVNSASAMTKFVWMIWGGDAYGLLDGYKIYDDATIGLLKKTNATIGGLRFWMIKNRLSGLKRKVFKSSTLKAIERVSYCTTVIPDDYRIFSERLPLRAKYVDFSYGIKDYFEERELDNVITSHILVGNSGYPSNNHLTVLEKLATINIGDRKIIVPLSYGPTKYIQEVIKSGKKLFEDSFIPVTDYLRYGEYANLLSGCSFGIMNHYRQQGMGNIILLLWMGVKVYLRPEKIGRAHV